MKLKTSLKSSICAGSLLLIACYAGSAQAQEAEAPGRNEIVVTAQKRSQNLQDVGISITAVNAEQIESLGWNNAEDIAAQTPGLIGTSFSGDSSVSLFSIRGVGQNDFADHQEAPTALYVDGAYIGATGAAGVQLFDVERVEVLRGPQGTLFGRNATGGLVHIITRSPTEDLTGYATVTLGDFDQQTIEAAVGGPIADNLSFRFAFLNDRADGYFENTLGEDARNRDTTSWRGKLRWTPTEATQIDLTAWQNIVDRNNAGAYDFRASVAELGDSPTDFQGSPDDTKPNSGALNPLGFIDKNARGFNVTISQDIGDLNLVSISDYQKLRKNYLEDSDSNPSRTLEYFANQDSRQFSQELRLSGDTDRLNWIVGAYYLNIDGDYDSFLDAATFGGATRNIYSLETKSWSVFGQLEYDLSDQVKLIGGLRYISDKKTFVFDSNCELVTTLAPGEPFLPGFPANDCSLFSSGDPLAPLIVEVAGPVRLKRSDNLIAGKAHINWQANEDLLFYAGYDRGVKAGSFTAPLDGFLTVPELPFRPEVLNSFEAGFKSTLFGGTTRINASIFHYIYNNYQGFVFQGLTSVVRNFDADMTGGEIEIYSTPVKNLDLAFGVALLDATAKDVETSPGVFEDQRIITAPTVKINGLIRKSFDLADGRLAVQVDGFYVSDQQYNTTNSPLASGDGYALLNGRIEYTRPIGNNSWSVAVFANNLTDKDYVTYQFDLSTFFGYSLQVFGPPRWFGVELGYKF